MKASTRRRVLAVLCAALLLAPPPALPPALAQPPTAAAPALAPEQLDALVAPVALYPDDLLTPLLIAATHPLEVVEAARWRAEPANAALTGDALAAALEPQPWDPGVKALVPFPTVLAMMNERLEWLQLLGDAFAADQGAVLAAVQRLRRQAQAAGTLQSTDQLVVREEPGGVVIVPSNPQVIYVPVYDPALVYGPWPYPATPPVVLPPPPGYLVGSPWLPGLAFAAGVAVLVPLWRLATPNWRGGHVDVDVHRWNGWTAGRPPVAGPQWRPPPRPPGAAAWPQSHPPGAAAWPQAHPPGTAAWPQSHPPGSAPWPPPHPPGGASWPPATVPLQGAGPPNGGGRPGGAVPATQAVRPPPPPGQAVPAHPGVPRPAVRPPPVLAGAPPPHPPSRPSVPPPAGAPQASRAGEAAGHGPPARPGPPSQQQRPPGGRPPGSNTQPSN